MILTGMLRPVPRKLRGEKLRLFFREMRPTRENTFLDVGGGLGIAGEFTSLYSFFDRKVTLNIRRMDFQTEVDTLLEQIIADGCRMPFASRSFDFVFCNPVIEHVGSWQKQEGLASSIRLIAKKGYLVPTPNKHFPLEPHTLLPFYHFMPAKMQKVLIRLALGYLKEYKPIFLLSKQELQDLFPEAKILLGGFPPLGINLVAYWKVG